MQCNDKIDLFTLIYLRAVGVAQMDCWLVNINYNETAVQELTRLQIVGEIPATFEIFQNWYRL